MTQVPPETGDSADTTPAPTTVTSPRARPKRSIGSSTIGTTTTSTATATGTGTDGESGISVEEGLEVDGGRADGEEEETEDDDEEEDEDEDDDEEEEEEEDEEPKLKYARLTEHLGPLYRNGDATSAFLTAGDKMVR